MVVHVCVWVVSVVDVSHYMSIDSHSRHQRWNFHAICVGDNPITTARLASGPNEDRVMIEAEGSALAELVPLQSSRTSGQGVIATWER